MKNKIVFVERKPNEFVSLEKAFRQIASNLSEDYQTEFQQAPYGTRLSDTVRNLLFFRKKPADIYHITGHINYIALLFPPRNTVLSIMDVRFLHAPNGLRRFALKKLYLDLPVRRLRFITAISDSVRDEIIFHTGCAPEKVRVLDLPLLEYLHSDINGYFNSEKPTILQVGTMANKNIANLAKALNGINCRMKIIGRMSTEQLANLRDNNVEFENLHDLTDSEMRNEYAQADIIAFCSTYEGFGLPIIEGQAMRKPVITSNLSPMRETAGGAAYLADPHDHESIRAGVLKIIGNGAYREKIIADGVKNIERFLPNVVAKQYERLYEEILE